VTKLGVVSNVQSQLNKRGMDEIDSVLADVPEVPHARLTGIDGLSQALVDFARQGVGVIVTNGGDGTVQAVLTELLVSKPFSQMPPIAVLPRGMTNMTAADVGPRGAAAKSLRHLIGLARNDMIERHLIRRHVLKVENIAGHSTQCGMAFGSAGIVRGVEVCRTKVHSRGLASDWANVVTLVAMLLGWILSGGRGETFRGETIAVSIDDGAPQRRSLALALATTLDRLILNARPFWNQGGGPVRFTSIADPPRRLLLYAYKVLYGPPHRNFPDDTYVSRGANRVSLEMDCPFTIDGQMFEPDGDKPVVVSAADEVDFVRF